MGHTVQSTFEITPRFANHVFLMDTGMLKEEYKGRPSALEIRNGRLTAYYADGEPKVLEPPARSKTARLPTLDSRGKLHGDDQDPNGAGDRPWARATWNAA
jgi:hypothetical protein